jgi:hypothetical protein
MNWIMFLDNIYVDYYPFVMVKYDQLLNLNS